MCLSRLHRRRGRNLSTWYRSATSTRGPPRVPPPLVSLVNMDPERHATELAASEQAAAMTAAAQAAQVAERADAAHAAAQHAAAQAAAHAAAYPAAPVPLAPPAQSDASVLRELTGAMQTLVVTMNTVIPARAADSARAPASRLKVPSPGEYDGKP